VKKARRAGVGVVAGVPLAVEPGGIAADRADEPPTAISWRKLRLMLMRAFAIFTLTIRIIMPFVNSLKRIVAFFLGGTLTTGRTMEGQSGNGNEASTKAQGTKLKGESEDRAEAQSGDALGVLI
jgi:hypothetical protein